MTVTRFLTAVLIGVLFLTAAPLAAQSVTTQDLASYQDSSAYSASAYYPAEYTQDRVGSLLSTAMPGLIGAAAGGLLGFKFGGMMGAVIGGVGGFIAGKVLSDSLGLNSASSTYNSVNSASAASQIYPYGSDVYSQYGQYGTTDASGLNIDPGANAYYGLNGAYGAAYNQYSSTYGATYDPYYSTYGTTTASSLVDDPSLPGATDALFEPLAPTNTSAGSIAREDRRARFLEKFDSNGNGRLDPEEHAAVQAGFTSRMDSDGDGAVSDAEKAAFRNARRERHGSDATPGLKQARATFRQAFTAYQEALKAGGAATAERAAFEAARETLHSHFREQGTVAEQ